MKKPTNKWAITMWVVGVLYILSQAVSVYSLYRRTGQMLSTDDWMHVIGLIACALFFNGGMLIGIGILIEMVDQIRWNGLSPEQRAMRAGRPLLWYLRRWPHDT